MKNSKWADLKARKPNLFESTAKVNKNDEALLRRAIYTGVAIILAIVVYDLALALISLPSSLGVVAGVGLLGFLFYGAYVTFKQIWF